MQRDAGILVKLLHEIGESPFSIAALQTFCSVKEVWRVASRLEREGQVIRIKRDLFVLSPSVIGHAIEPLAVANRICTPSYVSREAALSHWGLIPELVVNVTNSRLGRTVEFETPIGRFHYAGVDPDVYAIGLSDRAIGNLHFLCARPEKALYDLALARAHLLIRSKTEMRRFLLEDLRLDVSAFEFEVRVFDELIAAGRKRKMIELMKRELCHGQV